MPKAMFKTSSPQYLSLFPDWNGPRPLPFFMLENLLEARRQSTFPTNLAGPDEDVNIYLADLLTKFLNGQHSSDVEFGAHPLLCPAQQNLSRRQQAAYYRNNADHRLLMLGLFDRGDHLRKRSLLFGMNRQEAHLRDCGVGKECYQLAVNLLENRRLVSSGRIDVWRKLAENFDLYVQVLSTMAVSRLGLGATLSSECLNLMMTGPAPEEAICASDEESNMDRLLDLLLEFRQSPKGDKRQKKRAEVIDLALHLNLDPQKLLLETG